MKTLEENLLQRFIELISEKTGLHIRSQDNETLRKVVLARTKFHKLSSPEEYYQFLNADTDNSKLEYQELIGLLTVGESFFFRDKGQFELLKSRILPELIELRKKERILRIWSAGCSTGEEPYSLAILIDELIPHHEDWDILILGTDIKEEFLKKAVTGVYGAWSFRMVQPDIQNKYFHKRKDVWELDERIRKMVTYRFGDLLRDEFPGYKGELHGMDIILCRNVFIYYNRNAISAIVQKLANTLNDGGHLITGHGELYSVALKWLRPRVFPESLVYQRVKGVPLEAVAAKEGMRKGENFTNFPSPPLANPPIAGEKIRVSPSVISLSSLSEAETLFKRGAYKEAIEKGKAVLAEKLDFQVLCIIAKAYANLGEYDSAARYIQQAIGVDRLAPDPYYILAHIAEENGNTEEAKEWLKKVIYLEPSSVFAHLELAAIYEREGNSERARKMRKSACETLKSLPQDAIVEPYEGTTASQLISYLQKLI